MPIAAIFPGQGSQKPGMGRSLYEARKAAKSVFDEVAASTGIDIARLCFEADDDELRQTQNAQIALFTTSVAAFRCLQTHLEGQDIRIAAVAGHSVGEFAAVVASGSLSLAEGAKLVQIRGQLIAEAGRSRPGTMAAILGLAVSDLRRVLKGVDGVAVIANDNCPGQLVVSGEVAAVALAGTKAMEAGAKRVIPLNVSGGFHSPLMEQAAERFEKPLSEASFGERTTTGPIYSNVTSEAVGRESDLPKLLKQGLASTVRWTESVQNMFRDDIDVFIECGQGDVLSGLVKRIEKGATTYRVGDIDSLESTVGAIRP